jgi:hypothetical protein
MPVEIRELQIVATVQDSGKASSSAQGATPASGSDDIIAKCVEQVLEILKEKIER